MSAELCTSEQAITALGYLNNSFGGYPMTPEESRPYLRLFRNFDAAEVQLAIDTLARGWTAARRPMPNDVAKTIAAAKPQGKRPDGPFLEEQPVPEDFGEQMAQLRDPASELRTGAL